MFQQKYHWQSKKLDYVGGIYQPPSFFSEEMRDRVGHKPFFPWFIVYDFEAMLLPQQSHQGSIKWQTRHHPISVSVCSNAPSYRESQCFVSEDLTELLTQMVDYMREIAFEIYVLASHGWDGLVQEEDWRKYKQEVPVLGFNSAKYDMNLIKSEFTKVLGLHKTKDYFVVKKSNQYLCISNAQFHFLDISHYLAPGYSYAKFLKAYQTKEGKFFFPYEWFDSVDKLESPNLPPFRPFIQV